MQIALLKINVYNHALLQFITNSNGLAGDFDCQQRNKNYTVKKWSRFPTQQPFMNHADYDANR
jgi:hypothetical protein